MTSGCTVSLRQIYRCQVLNQKQELMGTVDDVLFHPTAPRAVGFSVKPYRVGGVIALPERYLLFENATFNSEGQLTVSLDGRAPLTDKERKEAKRVWGARAEKQLGFSWDESVIYYGQLVYTEQGELLGKVSDARFDMKTGAISVLQVSDGTSSDALLGKRSIPGELVFGFDSERFGIVCSSAAAHVPLEGGAAKQAGKTAATVVNAASPVASKLGESAIKGAAKAAVYTQRAARKAANSPQAAKTKKWLSAIARDVKDAMKDDE